MKKTCLLTGIYNYDIIIQREYPNGFVLGKNNKFIEKVVYECVGGTCGNVSTILPYLGVQTYPIAHFDLSDQGRALKKDLEYYGADVRFVRNTPDGGTTLLDCIHRLNKTTGKHEIGFHAGSTNDAQHPSRKPIKLKEVPAFLNQLDFVPDIFFFDMPEAGYRSLAEQLRKKGTLVYFEPESDKDIKPFFKAVEVSDIIKFSGTKVMDISFCDKYTDKLFIRTLGDEGLDFKLRNGDWQHVAVTSKKEEVDWEGAGDWLTSTFISLLCNNNRLNLDQLDENLLKEMLQQASETAGKSVGYLSSKGMIDAEKGRRPRYEIPDSDVPTRGILGAICGDIIGSTFELKNRRTKKTNFKLYRRGSSFTDDTTMTLAIARWLSGDRTMEKLEECMLDFAQKCSIRCYGHKFREWIHSEKREPYGAASNGSAMRVSAVGWVAHSLEECLELAKQTADITHNSEDGEFGAMSVAAAVYLARTGKSKAEIKQFIEERFGYNLSRKIEDIRPDYKFTSMASESVPEAIICWLQSDSYEEAVRNAVALGGDADTQAAIAGAIAAATPGMEIPKEIAIQGITYLTDSLKEALMSFEKYIHK